MAQHDLTGIVSWTVRNTTLTEAQVIAGILAAVPGTQHRHGIFAAYNLDDYAAADRWAEEQAEAHKMAAAAAADPAGYRTVRSPLYGEGRVYTANPGATQYRNAEGDHSVQIWDRS